VAVVKAIVIVGTDSATTERGETAMTLELPAQRGSMATVEVLGQSVLRRTIERLLRAGVGSISVFARESENCEGFTDFPNVDVVLSGDPWFDATRYLVRSKATHSGQMLIICLGPYVELDVTSALQFHSEQAKGIARAFDGEEPLDVWIVDPETLHVGEELPAALLGVDAAQYSVHGYVNRLENPRDLRRLITDSFNLRCEMRPHGFEVRPGVWMCEGADVKRGARIVPPVFIGCEVKISEQALITRCSNVERNSHVDYGTVVEDTSILPNSYVGIGLDLCHSIVDGNNLVNLQHGVILTITDSAVMRQNKTFSGIDRHLWTSFGSGELLLSAMKDGSN
jgi:hypothetical protein